MRKKLWFIKSKHQRDSFKGISQTEDSRCHRTQWKQSADEVSLKLECEVSLKPAENWYVWRSQDFAQLGTVAYTRLALHHRPPSDPNPNWTSICEEIWCFTTDLDRFCWEKWANNEAPCWNALTQTVQTQSSRATYQPGFLSYQEWQSVTQFLDGSVFLTSRRENPSGSGALDDWTWTVCSYLCDQVTVGFSEISVFILYSTDVNRSQNWEKVWEKPFTGCGDIIASVLTQLISCPACIFWV